MVDFDGLLSLNESLRRLIRLCVCVPGLRDFTTACINIILLGNVVRDHPDATPDQNWLDSRLDSYFTRSLTASYFNTFRFTKFSVGALGGYV
mgnify:CR=1 FL=1